MSRQRLLLLVVCVISASSAIARPRMIPIASSFIGASASSNPGSFLRIDSRVFFTADDGTHGLEPWVTDGTATGTKLVADICPGIGGSYPTMIGRIGSAAIFLAYETGTTSSLWRTNGTAEGTIKLMTVPAPAGNGSGYFLMTIAADTRVFVLVRQNYGDPVEIFASDGTVPGTQDIGAFPLNLSPTPLGVNGNLYFVGQDNTVGTQLWTSDGTAVGTHMVRRDVDCPGASCGPTPAYFFRIGTSAMFVSSDALWKTDGTGAGTQQIASIANGYPRASSPTSAVAYLTAADGTLWRTDGTTAGTGPVGLIATPAYSLVLDDGRLVFFHAANGGYDVWKSDGTAAGTLKIGTLPEHSQPYSVVNGTLGNRIFGDGWTAATGTELWMTDVDAGTVSLLKDIDPRVNFQTAVSSSPDLGIALGSVFLFSASSSAGRELWQTDGTAAGTTMLANIAPDPGGGVISGTVRAASDGTPIAGAVVNLCAPSGNGPCDFLVTDTNGAYHYDGVIPGTYSVSSSSHLYVPQYFDGVNCPCPAGSGTPVVASSGIETAGIDFSLIRGGTFAGNLKRASTGQPIPDVEIVILDSSGNVVDEQYTDLSGNYRSRGLMTGTYYAETSDFFNYDGHPAVDQVYHNHDCAGACDWHAGDAIGVTNGIDTTGIDFSLHEYATIAGTVRDDTGAGVSGLTVSFMRQGLTSTNVTATTDADGNYLSPLLDPGSYYVVSDGAHGFDVVVYPNGTCLSPYLCTPSGGTPVTVTADSATTGIDVQLKATQSRIAGTIRDRTGAPFSGIIVELRDANGYYISAFTGPATTDANGRYELDFITAGTYYVAAGDELYPGVDCLGNPCSVAAATPLVLTTGHTTRVDMQLLSQRTTISGRLLDAVSGQPILGTATGGVSMVSAAGYSEGSNFSDGGLYQVTTVSRDTSFYLGGYASGYHSLMYRNAPWTCLSSPCPPPAGATPIPAGTNTNIDFLLPRAGSVSGTVTDSAGAPIAEVQIFFKQTGGGSQFMNAFTDGSGHYKAYPLPGLYNSYAVPYTSNFYQSQVYRDHTCASTCDPTTGEVITITDGIETSGIDFHLGPSVSYGTIEGHVTDADTGLPMADVYVNVNNTSLSARTDAQGFYSIAHDAFNSGLTTGNYTLYAGAPQPYFFALPGGGNCADFSACYNSGTPVHVTAPKTTTVDFRMIKLRVASVSPAYGPATGGTQIVINGANFTSPPTVMLGGNAATVVSVTPTQIVAITPASSIGAAHVTVKLSASVSVTFAQGFTYLPTTTFTDDPIVTGVTVFKAAHIVELRAAVNRLRAAALLSDFPFTDPVLSGDFKAVHIAELRTALDQARSSLGLPPLSYTNAITPGITIIRAIDITEIRNGTR